MMHFGLNCSFVQIFDHTSCMRPHCSSVMAGPPFDTELLAPMLGQKLGGLTDAEPKAR